MRVFLLLGLYLFGSYQIKCDSVGVFSSLAKCDVCGIILRYFDDFVNEKELIYCVSCYQKKMRVKPEELPLVVHETLFDRIEEEEQRLCQWRKKQLEEDDIWELTPANFKKIKKYRLRRRDRPHYSSRVYARRKAKKGEAAVCSSQTFQEKNENLLKLVVKSSESGLTWPFVDAKGFWAEESPQKNLETVAALLKLTENDVDEDCSKDYSFYEVVKKDTNTIFLIVQRCFDSFRICVDDRQQIYERRAQVLIKWPHCLTVNDFERKTLLFIELNPMVEDKLGPVFEDVGFSKMKSYSEERGGKS